MHTHCTESDGDYPAKEVIRRYQEKGSDFLALSDHFLECYGFPVTETPRAWVSGFYDSDLGRTALR